MSPPDPQQEIERAARKHRTRAANKAAEKPSPAQVEAKRAEHQRSVELYMVRGAMSGSRLDVALSMIVATVMLIAPMLLGVMVIKLKNFGAIMGLALVTLVICFSSMMGMQRLSAAWRLSRLRRVGYGFDVDRYLAQLARKHRGARMIVRLQFARAWEPDARTNATDAVSGWMPELGAPSWSRRDEGETLELKSKEISTTEWTSGGKTGRSVRYFSNAKLHRCFAAILRKVVPPLSAANPIARLEAEIVGDVRPFDEKA